MKQSDEFDIGFQTFLLDKTVFPPFLLFLCLCTHVLATKNQKPEIAKTKSYYLCDFENEFEYNTATGCTIRMVFIQDLYV